MTDSVWSPSLRIRGVLKSLWRVYIRLRGWPLGSLRLGHLDRTRCLGRARTLLSWFNISIVIFTLIWIPWSLGLRVCYIWQITGWAKLKVIIRETDEIMQIMQNAKCIKFIRLKVCTWKTWTIAWVKHAKVLQCPNLNPISHTYPSSCSCCICTRDCRSEYAKVLTHVHIYAL